MVMWVKSLAAKTDDLSLIPGTPKMEGGNQLLKVSPKICKNKSLFMKKENPN